MASGRYLQDMDDSPGKRSHLVLEKKDLRLQTVKSQSQSSAGRGSTW